jgi:hypothetical protein
MSGIGDKMSNLTVKQLTGLLVSVFAIVGGFYSLYTFLDQTLVTKKERGVSDMTILIAIDRNRITTFELHEPTLTSGQKAELKGLRSTVSLNECERKKLIGLHRPDHKCSG